MSDSNSPSRENSREKLRSINAELSSQNRDLQGQIDSLGHANASLTNWMTSTSIGMLLLDSSLKMTGYTPSAIPLFNLIPADIGRALGDLSRTLDYDQLPQDAARVLGLGEVVEREIQSSDGHWYLARLLPYRTIDGTISGVVVMFLDITDRKAAEEVVRETNTILDERVKERTQELHDSESRLRVAVEAASHRANQMQVLATLVSEAEQKERRRLASILHDHVQQTLVAARLRTEVLANEAKGKVTQEHVQAILSSINETIDAVRTLAVELLPPLLHEQGLPAAVEWLVAQFQRQYGLQVAVKAGEDCTPKNENDRDLMFQAIRELLLNIVKHANVKQAEIDLSCNENNVTVVVRDEGAGIDLKQLSADSHNYGLAHIRERLAAVDGEMRITSEPGQGTAVQLQLPQRA